MTPPFDNMNSMFRKSASSPKAQASRIKVITLRAADGQAETLVRPDADRYGNVLFKKEVVEIPEDLLLKSFGRCVKMGERLSEVAEKSSGRDFTIDTIKIKIAIDAKFGCSLVADIGLEAAVEVEFRRVRPKA